MRYLQVLPSLFSSTTILIPVVVKSPRWNKLAGEYLDEIEEDKGREFNHMMDIDDYKMTYKINIQI